MNSVLRGIDRICVFAAGVAALLLGALFILGITEIILRSVFSISLSFSAEYAGYFLVLVLFLGSGWTLSTAGHIRVTLLSEHVSPKLARALDGLSTAIALIVSSILTAAMINYALGTWSRGTVSYYSSETPLAYPQAFLAIGLIVLTLALFARLIRVITGETS
ncbi:MAG: TRAP transporter small permease subunit [Alphaproteobacteria bacterium]|nr:TRAP transporter small permease subunit [Alphaproteobacteria bacterium]